MENSPEVRLVWSALREELVRRRVGRFSRQRVPVELTRPGNMWIRSVEPHHLL